MDRIRHFFYHYIFAGCFLLQAIQCSGYIFSFRGSDNFSVPIFTAVWSVLLFQLVAGGANPYVFPLVIVGLALLAVATVYKKWLTQSGAAAALWMGCIFFVTGGWPIFMPPVLFLLTGSLLSKLNKDDAEPNGRNAVQVLANGLIASICLLAYGISGQFAFFIAAIVSFSISMSDSTSSELGRYFGGKTMDIVSFRVVHPGISGGISVAGTVAGFAGAATLAIATGLICKLSVMHILLIMIAGFVGMLADSLLGSLLQAKYKSGDGSNTEKPGPGNLLVKGFAWCDNDVVNLLSNAVVTGIIILIFLTFVHTPQP
jgi:uncharacterized protein (TIGR00297 family)